MEIVVLKSLCQKSEHMSIYKKYKNEQIWVITNRNISQIESLLTFFILCYLLLWEYQPLINYHKATYQSHFPKKPIWSQDPANKLMKLRAFGNRAQTVCQPCAPDGKGFLTESGLLAGTVNFPSSPWSERLGGLWGRGLMSVCQTSNWKRERDWWDHRGLRWWRVFTHTAAA